MTKIRLPTLVWALLPASLLFLLGCGASGRLSANQQRLLSPHPFTEAQRGNAGPPVPTGVWKVQGAHSNFVYLAGGFHVVTKEQIPFPSTFYAAYQDSPDIYLEADVDHLSPLETARLLLQSTKWLKRNIQSFTCPKGKTIADYLQPETVAELKQFYGKKYSSRQRLNPVGLAFIAQAEALGEDYKANGGVDQVFALAARRDKKRITVLDDNSVEQMVGLVFDDMHLDFRRQEAEKGPDELVRNNVLGQPRAWGEALYWRTGDLEAINRSVEEARIQSPVLHQKLLVDRNLKWMPAIKKALEGERNTMIIVGIDHLGGDSGLIELLKLSGYKLEQLHGEDPLPRNPITPKTP